LKKVTGSIIPLLGYDHYDLVNPMDHLGGMWILWNNQQIMANDLLKEEHIIHMLTLDISM